MINILVVDDNYNYVKNLINTISSNNPNVRLFNFCADGEEVIDLISSKYNEIDITLLDLKIPKVNGLKVLDYIRENNLEKFKNSIIVISGEVNMISKLASHPYLYTYINKMDGFEKILKELNSLIEIKEYERNTIEYKIHQELVKLKFNFTYAGTKYLEESILILYNSDFKKIKLERKVYPLIAKKYKTTIINVKTNISHSVELMYYDCEENILSGYFGFVSDEKPTPKTIITTIFENLKYSS